MNYLEQYNKHKHKIYSYFIYHINDQDIAEDLTSETFLTGYEKIDSYNSEFEFSTWIVTIAKNKMIDYYRNNKIDISIDEISEESHCDFLKYEEDFVTEMDSEDKLNKVHKVLHRLPIIQKEIILMRYLSDLSTKEISTLTWKEEANIRKILSRWLKMIKELILIQ